MSVVRRPTTVPSLLGGSISLPQNPCRHGQVAEARPWLGAPGTAGTVAVVGAGKMGLPLAAQFAGHGWSVVAVDVQASVVESINAGRSHVGHEPGVAELVATAHADGRLRATTDGVAAARDADVVVIIVPVAIDAGARPDFAAMDAAVAGIAPGLRPGALVVLETTLPIGTTRSRYVPMLEAASGLVAERDLHVAFSPERLFAGAVLRNLASYPKLVGGVGPASTDRAAAFYDATLDAEIVAMSSAEAAEFAKLADTTYRDVNIALANEFALVAERVGVDVREVIAAANSQPYSHIHQPGLGVGGHCIPVYPHLLLSTDADLPLVAASRAINDAQTGRAVERIRASVGDLAGVEVLVLGLTYRDGVRELAFSRGVALVGELRAAGARVFGYDPLLGPDDIRALGAEPYTWAERADAVVVVTQTADPRWRTLDPAWFPRLRLVIDGRNSLDELAVPDRVTVLGIGVPPR